MPVRKVSPTLNSAVDNKINMPMEMATLFFFFKFAQDIIHTAILPPHFRQECIQLAMAGFVILLISSQFTFPTDDAVL